MGLESPVQKHTEHAELNDFSNYISHLLGPIVNQWNFKIIQYWEEKRRKIKLW